MRRPRRPRDPNQLAKLVVDIAIGDVVEEPDSVSESPNPDKNPHAVALGKLGGRKGGRARAEALSPAKRSEIAKQAARQRWRKK
jgi:hypothetical protein